jgi:hypothetical protein
VKQAEDHSALVGASAPQKVQRTGRKARFHRVLQEIKEIAARADESRRAGRPTSTNGARPSCGAGWDPKRLSLGRRGCHPA